MPDFAIERRPLHLKADLEAKVERAQQVVEQERRMARVQAVLAVLRAEPQAVQEGIMTGLKAMLGKQYAKASEGRKKARAATSPRAVAEAAFKGRAAA